MPDARSVGGIEQPDPPVPELGVARRCLREAGARHQRPAAAASVPGGECAIAQHSNSAEPMIPRETYLDWNATAPLRREAAAAVGAALARCGNPSSVHRWGRAARQTVECAREAVAALAGAAPDGVVFVSGGTEANHLALLGSGRERILVSAVEHGSVLQAAPRAERIPVDGDGVVDLAALDALLREDPRPALVS